MKCPSCGWSDDPLKDSFTGELIKAGDLYDVFPDGRLRLVKPQPAPEPIPDVPPS